MSKIVVRDTDSNRITIVAPSGKPASSGQAVQALFTAKPNLYWMAVKGAGANAIEHLVEPVSAANGEILAVEELLVSKAPASVLLRLEEPVELRLGENPELAEDSDVFLYAGTLPGKLGAILHKAEPNHGQYAQLIATILSDILNAPADETPVWEQDTVMEQSRDDLLDIYRGCAEIAAKLRRFDWQAALLRRAYAVKQSKYTASALSKALARDQRYPESRKIADGIIRDYPGFLESEHADHLAELEAFDAIIRELSAIGGEPATSPAKPTHVAYCLHNSLPFSQGGYAERSHGLAKAMADSGMRITAFPRPGFPSDGDRGASAFEGTKEIDGVTYHFHNGFGRRGRAYSYIADAADYYQSAFAKNGVSIVQAATNFWTALPAALAAHRLGLPFIYEVRSFWRITREAKEPGFSDTAQARRDEALEAITLALSDQVVTLNGAMADHLSNYGVASDRISIVPNSVDTRRFYATASESALAAEHDIGPGDTVIGYLGAMLDYEGLDLLVEAAAPLLKELPATKLLIVGANASAFQEEDSVENRLRALIEARGIEGSAKLIGRVDRHAIPAYYELFNICAYPRRNLQVCELVSPLKPLEAMAAGKAVIASDVAGMRDMVIPEETGLVFAAENIDALRSALSRLINKKALREGLGKRANAFVSENRRWSDAAAVLSTVYGKIENQQATRSPAAIAEQLSVLSG